MRPARDDECQTCGPQFSPHPPHVPGTGFGHRVDCGCKTCVDARYRHDEQRFQELFAGMGPQDFCL